MFRVEFGQKLFDGGTHHGNMSSIKEFSRTSLSEAGIFSFFTNIAFLYNVGGVDAQAKYISLYSTGESELLWFSYFHLSY